MRTKILFGFVAFIGLCGQIFAQMTNPKSSNEDLCDLCQPHKTHDCVTFIIYPENPQAGIYYCGPGVNIYDSEPDEG